MKREKLEALSREVITALKKKVHSLIHVPLWIITQRGKRLWVLCSFLNHQNEAGNISWFCCFFSFHFPVFLSMLCCYVVFNI